MILRNYDMAMAKRLITDIPFNNEQSANCLKKDIIVRNYAGYNTSTGSDTITNFYYWNSGYYTDYPHDEYNKYNSYHFLWPGGDIVGGQNYLQRNTEIDENKVSYEDFNLHRPFYGQNKPDQGNEIYGQPHTYSNPIYNETKDTWERKVTREFKNVSGHSIKIKELGVFAGPEYLVAREVLPEPIIVEDECYFKLSYTVELTKTHQHTDSLVNRCYSAISYNAYQIYSSGFTSAIPNFLSKNSKFLFIDTFATASSSSEANKKEFWDTLLQPEIIGFKVNYKYLTIKPYNEEKYGYSRIIGYLIMELEKIEEADNYGIKFSTSQFPYWRTYINNQYDNAYHKINWIGLNNKVKSITVNEKINEGNIGQDLNIIRPINSGNQFLVVSDKNELGYWSYGTSSCYSEISGNNIEYDIVKNGTASQPYDAVNAIYSLKNNTKEQLIKLSTYSRAQWGPYKDRDIVAFIIDVTTEVDSTGHQIPLYQEVPVQV